MKNKIVGHQELEVIHFEVSQATAEITVVNCTFLSNILVVVGDSELSSISFIYHMEQAALLARSDISGLHQVPTYSKCLNIMATFGKALFNAVSYASFHPTYPRSLFNFTFDFHRRSFCHRGDDSGGDSGARTDVQWECAINLGCGTGEEWWESPILLTITAHRSSNSRANTFQARHRCRS